MKDHTCSCLTCITCRESRCLCSCCLEEGFLPFNARLADAIPATSLSLTSSDLLTFSIEPIYSSAVQWSVTRGRTAMVLSQRQECGRLFAFPYPFETLFPYGRVGSTSQSLPRSLACPWQWQSKAMRAARSTFYILSQANQLLN